ncbi:MAG: 1-phosphofructokinase [Ruminococcaceae bacterium]|nr:1-phosphofructokinase [Oscillospiraceae bacterium]
MIYTVTLNPALDYLVDVEHFRPGTLNKADASSITFGGKGLNVSAVLKTLGVESRALGFVGGFTGNEIIKMAEEVGCNCDFIDLPGQISRINVKIKHGEETELNGEGPQISSIALNHLYGKLSALTPDDFLVLSGSVPKSMSNTVYMDIMTRLPEGVKTIVDASGAALKNTLKCRPYLIKPNIDELSDIFGAKISVKTDAVFYGKKLVEAGAENVLVSMGGQGAVLITENEAYEMNAPAGTVVNTIGAGDSMVAGFLAAIHNGQDIVDALHLAVCAGSATAFCETLAERDEIFRLLDMVIR